MQASQLTGRMKIDFDKAVLPFTQSWRIRGTVDGGRNGQFTACTMRPVIVRIRAEYSASNRSTSQTVEIAILTFMLRQQGDG